MESWRNSSIQIQSVFHTSLCNLGASRGECSTPHPRRFTRRKEPQFSLYGRLGGPQTRSGRVWKNGDLKPAPHNVALIYMYDRYESLFTKLLHYRYPMHLPYFFIISVLSTITNVNSKVGLNTRY